MFFVLNPANKNMFYNISIQLLKSDFWMFWTDIQI